MLILSALSLFAQTINFGGAQKHENGRGWRGAVERLVDFGFRGVLSCFGVWVLENVGLLNDSKCAIS